MTWLVPPKPRNSYQRKFIKNIGEKQKLPCLDTSSRKKNQHDQRLIDGFFYKNIEIHVSSSL